jgi:hypothetical protein
MAAIPISSDWWCDTGATVNVSNDKGQFKTYEVSTNEYQVLMDNHNKAKVHLYGTVELMMSSGKKLVLINVLYVPDMKKNLVSTNLLGKSGLNS